MLYWSTCIKSLDRCSAQLKLILPTQSPSMTSMFSLIKWHGHFALPIKHYLKPQQVHPYPDVICSLLFYLWLTGMNLEDAVNHYLIVVTNARIINALTTITRLEIKYLLRKKVSSTEQSPNMARNHGLFHTNGTIRIQCVTKSERLNILRVTPFTDKIVF